MKTEPLVKSGMTWGWIALGILVAIYLVVTLQIPPRTETGIRVIPWQAPDLEISPSNIDGSKTSVPEE